jgi:3-methyladenine DNA glycosylase/8-oxoguanine DNA glycosylase
VQLHVELTPAGPYRLPARTGLDRLLRRRGATLERLLHHGEEPVLVRVGAGVSGNVLLTAHARHRASASYAITRMRFALGVDEDLSPFRRRFARDRVIGASLRARPWLRPQRRPEPFEALVCAICEQLIEYQRAAAIERRLVARLGRSCPNGSGLRDMPSAVTLAGVAPALLASMELTESRALALLRAAREVARGRIDLSSEDHERSWRALRRIPGIGSWTVEMLALHGQGRNDQVPAADVGLMKLVGRWLSGGDPRARATELQVREFFAPYGQWAGVAACHLLMPPHTGLPQVARRRSLSRA